MAAFSFHHHHPFLPDSVFLRTPTIKASVFQHEGEINSSPISFYEPQSLSQTKTHEREVFAVGNSANSSQEASFTEKRADSSSLATDLPHEDKSPQKQTQSHTSGKKRDGPSLNSAQSKRKCSGNPRENEEKKAKGAKKNEKKGTEEEPKGYIHVRARRGQATDSHSLAERVRREKISERMKMLQALVPGCDKVTGKALMLDEIINYVQSLQNQVEFLSMKLASVSPVFYDFSVDLDNCTSKPEKIGTIPSPLPFIQQSSYSQDPAFSADTAPVTTAAPVTTSFPTANSYCLMDSSVAALLHWQRPNAFSQDNVNLAWNLDSYNNMCSFP